MDAILQNFRRSFGSTTPFFHSLSLDPPTTMEELYRRVDKYSTPEDNIRATSQTVMITAQSSKPATNKQYLVEPPVLASLEVGETLFAYLVVSDVSVSATLFKEGESKKQRLAFFVNKSLADAKTRYIHLEQVALALWVATKKIRPYF